MARNNKGSFLRLRRLHGSLYEWKQRFIQRQHYRMPPGKKVYVIGTPLHSNLGDSAIVLAQIEFLKRIGHKDRCIKEIPTKTYYAQREFFKRIIRKKDRICFPGGGNIGNLWPVEDRLRYTVLEDFSGKSMVLFPQTLYFTPDADGDMKRAESIKYYNNNQVTLAAREQNSYRMMQQYYPKASVLLVPDIVLSVDARFFGVNEQERTDEILLCLRRDEESALSETDEERLKQLLSESSLSFRCTDMHKDASASISVESRLTDVCDKLSMFACASLVITDRLHGMIFAAISGTPCIALDNKNHKVRGSFAWIQDLSYVRFAENIEQVRTAMADLFANGPGNFDSEQLQPYFFQLREVIRP